MKTLLVLTMLGQCYAGNRGYVQQRSYGYSYPAPTYYAAPTYNNQIYYAPYVEKVKFVAVEQPSYDYYAALAASSLRSYERFQEYAQVPQTAALTYSIPSQQPVQVAQQPVYQAQAPVNKQQPVQQAPVQQASPQQYQAPVQQASPQQYQAPVQQASPQYQVQQQASPQQQETYQAPAPAKTPPVPSSTPGAPGKSYDDGTGNVPPPIIQQRMDYSSAMGSGTGEVPPPPPVPAPPQAYQQQQQMYLKPTPVVSSVNSHFLSVVSKNCASCHTGASSKGGFSIFDYPGRLASLSQDDLQNIANQVSERKMPYKRVMSESDRRALLGMLGGNVSSLVSR